MKRILALALALLLVALPALAEPMSYLDYTDDVLEDGSPIYYFKELSMKLPADWQGKVFAMPEEGRTAFYQKASYDKYRAEGLEGGGFLFALGTSVDGSFSRLPAFEYLGYSEESSLNYYLQLPSDYPAYLGDEAIRAEYDAMHAQMSEVVAGVRLYADDAGTIEPDGTGPNDAAEAGAAQEETGITLDKMRYHFEHSALPRYFYDDPANMLSVLKANGVYRLWMALADENRVAYPYVEADFTQNWYEADDGTTILQIGMPAPEVSPQCYRVYMVYNAVAATAGYYTIEYENLLGDCAFTCGWTADMTHMNYGDAAILNPKAGDYDAALLDEARQVAALAGVSGSIRAGGQTGDDGADDLAVIECPEQGFVTKADPAYPWDYQEGTGITIYTEHANSIPYVIVWRGDDLIVEPLEYIREQFTPHMQSQYGEDLVSFVEYEFYDIGGKQLPAGLYTYRLQGHQIDMLRVYDSTGDRTVAYTCKYIQGQGEATLAALDAAVRNFEAM